ncbi:MAG TPA: dTDP-glucose 4,6-dehydratase [Terriglobia bacterium]|nr:dTDP-glucose 4,6-dehydratase [Terriglobia bacterium]
MRIIVTGGAGFIGSNFIHFFLKANPDAQIINLDKLTYAGNLDNLSRVQSHPNYRFVKGDVADKGLLNSLLDASVDAIVHFAAETHVDRSIAGGAEFVQTNVLGTFNLLETARQRRVERFVYVSTDEVYGSLGPGEFASEDSPLQPNSPYAATKGAADLLARSFWHTYRFPVLTTRSSNNYGPWQFPEKLIPLMIAQALEGKKLPVYGDGLNERDWIFVEDHCRAIARVLEAGRPGEIYNIGYGQPVTNLEIIRRLLQILNKPGHLIEFVADRPGHDRRYALNTQKLRSELAWEPAVELESGLKETVQWYQSHASWISKARSGEYQTYYEKFYKNRETTLSQL